VGQTDLVARVAREMEEVVHQTLPAPLVVLAMVMLAIDDADHRVEAADPVEPVDLEAGAGFFAATGTGSTIPRSLAES
jgi:hypothetical protein